MFVGVSRKTIVAAAIVVSCGHFEVSRASADELAIPYTCAIERGEPKLYAGPETRFKILGRRDEQPFVSCPPGASNRCETMMIHRFAIECDGVRQAWSRVAGGAAKAAGVQLPENMPNGFAPVGALAGRIVMPSLIRGGGEIVQVATQDLSPDSVMEHDYEISNATEPAWTTTVRADASAQADSGALSVAIWLAAVLLAMFAASMVAAGRWRPLEFEFQGAANALSDAQFRATRLARDAYFSIDQRLRRIAASWFADEDGPADHALFNASLLLHTKLAEAELALAALPSDLLLREVLHAEIAQVRLRAGEADRRTRSRSAEKSAAVYRSMHRELDRITRIAHGAACSAPSREPDAEFDSPQSPTDAYRILGLNAEAPPAAAKKMIDALRMTWHPDLARSEPDRALREARMKQINAAWDLIRERRKAA